MWLLQGFDVVSASGLYLLEATLGLRQAEEEIIEAELFQYGPITETERGLVIPANGVCILHWEK